MNLIDDQLGDDFPEPHMDGSGRRNDQAWRDPVLRRCNWVVLWACITTVLACVAAVFA